MNTIIVKSPDQLSGMGLGSAELAYNDAKKFVKDNPDSAIQTGVAIANDNKGQVMVVLAKEITGKDVVLENVNTKEAEIDGRE